VTWPAATTRGVTIAALMATLGRPSWWLLALAGFLVRGGILLFVLAIVSLPSPLALSNVLAPDIQAIYLGQVGPATAVRIAVAVFAAVTWLVGGSWIAAATEVVLVRDARTAAVDEGLPVAPATDPGRLLITRATLAHLLCLVPLAVAVGLGSIAIGEVGYREFINPSDSSPVVLRVLAGAVGPVVAIVVAWILGEIVGGGAVRRVVLLGEPVPGAVGRATSALVRHPIGNLAAPLATLVVVALDLTAVLLVVTIVWSDVRDRLLDPAVDGFALGLTLLTFAGAWCLALIVTGLVAAWRSVAMSFETGREAAAVAAPTGTAASTLLA